MKKVTLQGHKIEIYDSIDELPIVRFQIYNKYLLLDCGIGSDMESVDERLERVYRYIKIKDLENLQKEVCNLREAIYFVISELSPRYMAFCCLVGSLDGKKIGDTSDDIREVYEILKFEKKKDIDDLLDAAKTKICDELDLYFPSIFESTKTKEYYDLIKRKTTLTLDDIANGTSENEEEIDRLTDKLLTFIKPQVYSGKNGAEVNYTKNFESICVILSSNYNIQPKTMTTLAFYNAYELHTKEQDIKTKQRHG